MYYNVLYISSIGVAPFISLINVPAHHLQFVDIECLTMMVFLMYYVECAYRNLDNMSCVMGCVLYVHR